MEVKNWIPKQNFSKEDKQIKMEKQTKDDKA